jgi:hypothetical protein
MWFCSFCKNGNTTADGKEQELMFDGQDLCKDPAHVGLFKTISADTLAGHPSATLTAKPLPPGTLRMVLANPADAKANLAIRIRHAVSVKFDLRKKTSHPRRKADACRPTCPSKIG